MPLGGADDAALAEARYVRLEAGPLLVTLDRLHERILLRFPERNLARVAAEVRQVIQEVAVESATRRRQQAAARAVSTVVVAIVVGLAALALALSVRDAVEEAAGTPAFEWLSVVESAIQDVVFAALAVFFLLNVPARQRRRRSLATLHRLRSLAHVIDMHQLTKDPERLRADFPATTASPRLDLTAEELGRYLDYCSELLALVGKGAALCARDASDAVVLDTVSEIETLTVGMSRKIWQKISLLREERGAAGAAQASSAT